MIPVFAATGVYEIIPGFICSFIAIILFSLISKTPTADMLERFDKADQIYKESAEHHPRMASQYALAINRQVPELESIIAKDGRASVEYAIHVLKKRFCEGEYAIYVICGPFPLGEKAIAKDADYSFLYAKYILKQRFILGEPIIFKDVYVRLAYTSQFNIV